MDCDSPLVELQTYGQQQILDTVMLLWKGGLTDILSLPQIVFCGDQSSGKSSVFDRITGIPVHQSEKTCTRFVTEIILRRRGMDRLTVGVIPDGGRPQTDQDRIEEFSQSTTNFNDLLVLIGAAMEIMGISNSQVQTKRPFTRDILIIEIEGPCQPQVTLVDIPGLNSSTVEGVSEADIAMVSKITDRYISQPDTICVPILQASNDVLNQSIFRKVAAFDPEGERTLGVITKIDEVPTGSGDEIELLHIARNEVVFLRLGWHVVKSLSSQELGFTTEECNNSEVNFFAGSIFGSLPGIHIGISKLRLRLGRLLFERTKNDLPHLTLKLEDALQVVRTELKLLGHSRLTPAEGRESLTKLSMVCYDICKSSVQGHYDDQYFKRDTMSSRGPTRLRAAIQLANLQFTEALKTRGQKYQSFRGSTGEVPTVLSEEKAKKWALAVLVRSRGTELVGSCNPDLIAELYWEQSSPWEELAIEYVQGVWKLCEDFLEDLLTSKVPQHVRTRLWSGVVAGALNERRKSAFDELKKILDDQKSLPINYNHRYTECLQRMRVDRFRRQLKRSSSSSSSGPALSEGSLAALVPKTAEDVASFTCVEALDCIGALYQTEHQVFLANVTTQVVERHLIRGLEGIFAPMAIARLPDDKIEAIIAEPELITRQRDFLKYKLKMLEETQSTFCSMMGQSTVPILLPSHLLRNQETQNSHMGDHQYSSETE
ncbi:interferon-induced GTP-binding protein Mx [Xylaria cf. heliscus]|nr:interferon-induced GTP-binding protein Mx [Xylaria cf. heliscus]